MLDRFLVCGLGSLGQHCIAALTSFGVIVNGIDIESPKRWDVPEARDLLTKLIIGDCRQVKVLESAEIKRTRAILLVTNNESVNVAGAFAARRVNPHVRIVLRSNKKNLNELLEQQLGNFIAFEASQLPASAFALAALGGDTLGFFNLDGHLLRVVKHHIHANHQWFNQTIYDRNSRIRRVLSHVSAKSDSIPKEFYGWDDETIVKGEDTIIRIETADSSAQYFFRTPGTYAKQELQEIGKLIRDFVGKVRLATIRQKLEQIWQSTSERKIQRVALVALLTVFILLSIGTIIFEIVHPDFTLEAAFYNTAIFLLGGFGDQFGGFQSHLANPWWLNLFSLSLTVSGTVFVGILYATLTDLVLSSRFEFSRRPPIPKQDHVILVGLGRVGTRVATLLQELQQPVVGVTNNAEIAANFLPKLPLVTGKLSDNLEKLHIAKAKSIIIATEDEIENLEIGLMTRRLNPLSNLVIRTYDPGFTESLAEILPDAKVVCPYALAAEAFAGAAFGENIISLFRLNEQTVLVTEYCVESGDTLEGLLMADIAYGYEVVPILHQRSNENASLMPVDEIRLQVGDRMVVLATINGLQRIEKGERISPRWAVSIEKALRESNIQEAGNIIARFSGCELAMARDLMNNLPGILRVPLYKQQAQNLVRELSKMQVKARVGFVKKLRWEVLHLETEAEEKL